MRPPDTAAGAGDDGHAVAEAEPSHAATISYRSFGHRAG